jgi:hypothetical protein
VRNSLDHLVGEREQRRRHSEAECFRCLEIDNQFELGSDRSAERAGLVRILDPRSDAVKPLRVPRTARARSAEPAAPANVVLSNRPEIDLS